jgi:uncharacterized protein YueI
MSVQALLHAYNENGLTLYSKIHIKYDIKRFYLKEATYISQICHRLGDRSRAVRDLF